VTLPRNVDDAYPLTPMQRLMLLHAISAAGNGVLLNQVCYDIYGPLDAEAFRRAWDALVARHAALRTAFLWDGLDQPLQVVRTTVSLPYRSVDLTGLAPDEREQSLEALRREDLETPLTLGRAPLMRCTIARLAPEHHRFLWAIHHLVVDRWSHGVLFSDLRARYAAYACGDTPQLDPAPQFREYVAWIAQQDRGAAERFWQEELSGVHEPTLLGIGVAAGRPRARLTTSRSLSRDATAALRERAGRWHTTPGAVLLSAVGLLLARRCARDDAICGVTVSGRPPHLGGAETVVGSFVNNLPARFVVRRDQPLDAWVRDVQRAQARRESFAHVSLGDIHAWSELPSSRPLFDTLVLLNLTNDSEGSWPGIELVARSATLDAGYPFILSAAIQNETLVLGLVHDDTFEQPGQVLTDLEALVERLCAAPDGSLVGDLVPATVDIAPRAAIPEVRAGRNGATPDAPLGTIADRLLVAWRDVLGLEDIGLDDNFFALGGTSLQAAQLFARVERTTGKAIPLSTLFAAGSVRALVAEIDRPIPRSGPLVRLRSSGTRVPLYAIPGIGGNVVGLGGLARQLGPDQPFSAFESPGLNGREEPLASIEAIAARYADELLRENTGPFHLLGICWGAAVAFEMATQLGKRGRAPASLVMMDPAALLRETAVRPTRVETAFIRQRLELYWDEFREGGWSDRGRLLASKAKRAAKVLTGAESLEQSQSELNQVRVREANKEAITRYAPGRLAVRARVFITADRDLGGGPDPRGEWLTLIDPMPGVVSIVGTDSGDAISPAKVGGFAAALRTWLETASAESP